MRKHNRRMAMRWGSVRVIPQAAAMSHDLANNRKFQLNCNSLLMGLLRRAGV